VSVIMPTRNRSELLKRAIASVASAARRYPSVEVVVVDDGSDVAVDERSLAMESELSVRVIRRARPAGPSAARNAGLDAAGGDVVGFLDDDDTLHPDALRDAVAFLQQGGQSACSAWHAVVHPDNSSVTFRAPTLAEAQTLRWFDVIAAPFACIDRAMAGKELWFDESLSACEDWDLWLRLAQSAPVPVLPHPLYEYHQHGAARVTRTGTNVTDGRRAFLAKHGDSMSAACRRYHEAVIALIDNDRPRAVRTAASSPQAALMLATTYGSARIGLARSDPGAPARAVARITGSPALLRHRAQVRDP